MKNLVATTAFLFIALLSFAQGVKKERKEAIEAQKIAFLTSKMDLNSKDAAKFWPVYNAYKAEMSANRKNYSGLSKNKQAIDELSDKQLEEIMVAKFAREEQKLKIEQKYFAEFKKVISTKQLAKFYKGEDDFRKEVLKELKRRNRE